MIYCVTGRDLSRIVAHPVVTLRAITVRYIFRTRNGGIIIDMPTAMLILT